MMRRSKVSLLVLGLVVAAIFLFISSEVAATTAQGGTSTSSENRVNDQHIHGDEDAFPFPKRFPRFPTIRPPRPPTFTCRTCCNRGRGSNCRLPCCRCCYGTHMAPEVKPQN
ncbi:hypothetical protein SAY87_011631 [Trapa incisa]|uniref:Uncharacterized protein n=1 Tax=Trapa incisa TaxID=236973 RepID=A0AAN7GWL2_9MYRT|nr:hypothetical protein SAY87_011631 [Trapa incisa]